MADQSVRKGGLSALRRNQSVNGRPEVFDTLVDIVFVIDGTGSMQNLLDEVKERALSLHREIIEGLANKNRRVTKMRVKVLIFRDIYVDANAFEESDFFTLPEDAEEFRDFVEHIRATGGGDEPESGLEALHRAMKVRFQENIGNNKARQIIIVMTDASAHPLDDPQREGDDLYPQEVPKTMAGLQNVWESVNKTARRLLVMAPNAWPWTVVSLWNEAECLVAPAGCGISKDGFDAVIKFISGSI